MIVACESCNAKFRLDPGRLKGPKSKVRCSRCGHVFRLSEPEDDVLVNVDLSDDEADIEEEKALKPSTTPSRSPIPAPPVPSKAKKPFPVKILLTVLLPLLLLGGGIFWFLSQKGGPTASSPGAGEKTSAREVSLPVVSIQDSTQAYFLQNAHIGQIFVVEGEITNESGKPVSFVLLEGKLHNRNNQVAQAQKCFAGNPIGRDELTQLGATELQNRMMNREGKDLLNVRIPAGKRVPFLLVFHNLPEMDSLSDYSVEVISAKAE